MLVLKEGQQKIKVIPLRDCEHHAKLQGILQNETCQGL